jgi:two-component system chemotaxis response regulator CheB
MTVRVLVVDDSIIVRSVLSRELARDPEIEVVGTACDPYDAREQIVQLKPDVVTLDIEMPKMDGISFLKKLMEHYLLPVIIVSSLTASGSEMALTAISSGAVDVLCKPNGSYSMRDFSAQLAGKVKDAAKINMRRFLDNVNRREITPPPARFSEVTEKILVIGASTGGTIALERILTQAPANCPPIVIVQHMPPGFTKAFADRLDKICPIDVKEACAGDELVQGRALIAPGNLHTSIRGADGRFIADVKDGPLVSGHRPSVDVLFSSAAKILGARAIGIILTGMGSDGADGMLAMKNAGAYTLAQDEATCVVFGMPRVAIEKGGAQKVLPLEHLLPEALRFVRASSRP